MVEAAVEALFELYERKGAALYGEGVSQLDHALQCAQLAADDLGHLLESESAIPAVADARHESSGAAALRELFGPQVARPIALHVVAKRYLCAVEPGYGESLSEASRHSLRLQGGPLSAGQARRFERGAHFAEAVRLRRYDEAAKVEGAICRPLRDYGDLLTGLCLRNLWGDGR
jgi:predicted HD phosphohydrolase